MNVELDPNSTVALCPQELQQNTNQAELNTIATYYFDGQGKALRPMVAILMARAVNYHVYGENRLVSHYLNNFQRIYRLEFIQKCINSIFIRDYD